MKHLELIELLVEKGFDTGWVLQGTELVLWEHEEEPPAPLIRPTSES